MTPACIIVLNQEPKPARDQRTINPLVELFVANVLVPKYYVIGFLLLWRNLSL